MEKASLNRVILVGRIGNKPEGRYTPSGASTASFSVATNEVWGDGEDRKERTEWHNIVAWNKTADFVTQYIQKGQLVCLEGTLRTRTWKDKDDNNRRTTEVICSSLTPLEWRSDETAAKSSDEKGESDEENLPF